MKTTLFFRALIFLCVLAASANALAKDSLSVGEFGGSGVSPEQINTVKNLVTSAIANSRSARLVSSGGDGVFSGTLTKLDVAYLVSFRISKTDGTVRTQEIKITSFDEIDVATRRLTEALIRNVPVENTVARGEVLETEQKETSTVRSSSGTLVFLGGGLPIGDALQSNKVMFAFGGGYGWEIRRFLIELRGDFMVGYNEASMNVSSFTIGGNYIFLDRDEFALYAGLESGFANFGDDNGDNRSGFGFAGNVGALLLRYANVNLDARIRTIVLADTLNGQVPAATSLLFGIHF